MISLEQAKTYLRVTGTAEDTLIEGFIASAVDHVESATGKKLERTVVTQMADRFDTYLPLDWGPDPEDLVITYVDEDGASQDVVDANIVSARAYPADAWPTAKPNTPVILEYTAGYTTVPPELNQAILLHVRMQYDEERTGKDTKYVRSAIEAAINRVKAMFV